LQTQEFVDLKAALSLRTRLAVVRVVLMAVIAVMLNAFAGWSPAPAWWAVYAILQYAIIRTPTTETKGQQALLYGLTLVSYALAGFPAWRLWTHLGDLGAVTGTMYLCGMLVQLVVSSLGSRTLFWFSAGPLIAYLIAIPPLAYGASRLQDGLIASGCAALFVLYMAMLWVGQQRALLAMEQSRKDAIAARRDAEAASQAKTDFLAVMSHELRTPMNAVLGAAELLSRSRLDPVQRDHLTLIADGGAVLMHVLNDVLDLAKIEAGKLSMDPASVDVHDVFRRCASIWAPRAHDKGLEFQTHMAPGVPRHLVLDEMRLSQIVFNLLSNAVKFTETGSVSLTFTAEEIDEGHVRLRISVSDTGVGIAPEAQGRLFRAFEQADSTISRRHGGTGLGLSISRRLAQMMDGDVRVASVLGLGSTFDLTLTCQKGEARATRLVYSAVNEDHVVGFVRILVAEDNPANQKVIGLFLHPIGAHVTMVEHGQEALEALALEPFDLVLMDLQMPVMDGLEATRRLRAGDSRNHNVPVLALTANVLDSHRRACLEAGMNGFIAKPIDARALLSEVFRALAAGASTPAVEQPASIAS
jgi:signal transduction histidine kinase/AmiR/NasT family two-component response regulator